MQQIEKPERTPTPLLKTKKTTHTEIFLPCCKCKQNKVTDVALFKNKYYFEESWSVLRWLFSSKGFQLAMLIKISNVSSLVICKIETLHISRSKILSINFSNT